MARAGEAEMEKELAVQAVTLHVASYAANKQRARCGARQDLEYLDKIYK